jgi:nucleotide-binding universal stress UspA family protein
MSNPFQHILVPVDLSTCSAAALTLAAQLAEVHGSRLAVLHANDATSDAAHATEADIENFVRSVLGAATTPSVHVAAGAPRDVILTAVVSLACDAIVLGTHGRTGRPRMLVGSVAESVVRAASCPVVTVRERA